MVLVRRVGRAGELGRAHVERDRLAADEAARRELVPALRAARLLEDLGLRVHDVPLAEVAEPDDAQALVGGLRGIMRRPLGAARDGRHEVERGDADGLCGAAVGRAHGEVHDAARVGDGVGRCVGETGRAGRCGRNPALARRKGRERRQENATPPPSS